MYCDCEDQIEEGEKCQNFILKDSGPHKTVPESECYDKIYKMGNTSGVRFD